MRRNEIGQHLYNYRRAKKLTLREVSEKTGVSVSNLSEIERGENHPGWETLETLGRFYEFIPEIVFYGKFYEDNECNDLVAAIADMRSVFFKACPGSFDDHRFYEMMGSPDCVIGYVTEYLARIAKGLDHIVELRNEHRKANKPISLE